MLSSETGSGKSTQFPQQVFYDEFASGLTIACTQPKRLAATRLAERVAHEMGVKLGEEVGYAIRFGQKHDENGKKTRLKYMTEGSLLQEMKSDSALSRYVSDVSL